MRGAGARGNAEEGEEDEENCPEQYYVFRMCFKYLKLRDSTKWNILIYVWISPLFFYFAAAAAVAGVSFSRYDAEYSPMIKWDANEAKVFTWGENTYFPHMSSARVWMKKSGGKKRERATQAAAAHKKTEARNV